MAPLLEIRLLGPVDVLVHGAPAAAARSRSVTWLLVLLALRHPREVPRSRLAGLLWPDTVEPQALYNLRRNLSDLRRVLGPEAGRLLAPRGEGVRLDLDAALLDVAQFDCAVRRGDEASLLEAVALYRGDLAEGCGEEWIGPEREARTGACAAALETLADLAAERGDHAAASRHLRRAAALEPFRDSVRRRLLHALVAGGDAAAALLVYREYRARLHAELNSEPDAQTTRLFQQIRDATRPSLEPPSRRRSRPPGGDAASGTAASGAAGPTPREPEHPLQYSPFGKLPCPLTGLIGRGQELAEIATALSEARLVTLVGFGGVGKTRLAIEVARSVEERFAEGAAFVDLAALADPALLPAFVGAALGVGPEGAEARRSALEAVSAWCASRRLLLVLDNCEHLAASCAGFARGLLLGSPGLRVLATSRQPLGVTGEVVQRVLPLSLDPPSPARPGPAGPEAVLGSPACRLFVERARARYPEASFSGSDAGYVAQICRRLDGIPLAIELAAARVGALTVRQVAAGLDDRLGLLDRGPVEAAPRHQTLRGLIDWSYGLLTVEEQALFRRCSLLVDEWSADAARALRPGSWPRAGSAARADGSERDVLDLLDSLVRQSLLVALHGEEGLSYRMLETLREYALGELLRNGDEPAMRRRHFAYFLSVAEAGHEDLLGPGQAAALRRMAWRRDNLRAALAWAASPAGTPEAQLQLASALWPYWWLHGHLTEGREQLRAALGRSANSGSPHRARALQGASALARAHGDLHAAVAQGTQAAALFQQHGDPLGEARALFWVGWAEFDAGRSCEARRALEDSLRLARRHGYHRETAAALTRLGLLAYFARCPDQARAAIEEAAALAREHADDFTTALALHALADVEAASGDYERAQTLLQEALVRHERLGFRHAGAVLVSLSELAQIAGDRPLALQRSEEAVVLGRDLGRTSSTAWWLQAQGNLHYRAGAPALAAMRYEESLAIFRELQDCRGTACVCNCLGSARFHEGQIARAQALHREALPIYTTLEVEEGIVWSLERLAGVEAAIGDPLGATRLLGAASELRARLGIALTASDQADLHEAANLLQERLGASAFRGAWDEGQVLDLENVVSRALEGTRDAATTGGHAGS